MYLGSKLYVNLTLLYQYVAIGVTIVTMDPALLHLINIHDLITPCLWSILPMDELFSVRYFCLLHNDLIPYVMVRVIKQIPHGSIGKVWQTTVPRY